MSNWQQLSPSAYHQMSVGKAFGLSDVGLTRPSNEDNFLIDQELGLLTVGDGMGGHNDGEVASATALVLVRDFIYSCGQDSDGAPTEEEDPDATWVDRMIPVLTVLSDALRYSNHQLYLQNQALGYSDGRGMGTTVTGLWLVPEQRVVLVFHVGDSRLYRYRDGELRIVTRDHTVYQQAIEQGLLDNLPPRNLLLQAVGPSLVVAPDVQPYVYQSGDLYLLCTDGLYGVTPHDAIRQVLHHTVNEGVDLEMTCSQLIHLAKQHESRDNITALLLLCD